MKIIRILTLAILLALILSAASKYEVSTALETDATTEYYTFGGEAGEGLTLTIPVTERKELSTDCSIQVHVNGLASGNAALVTKSWETVANANLLNGWVLFEGEDLDDWMRGEEESLMLVMMLDIHSPPVDVATHLHPDMMLRPNLTISGPGGSTNPHVTTRGCAAR